MPALTPHLTYIEEEKKFRAKTKFLLQFLHYLLLYFCILLYTCSSSSKKSRNLGALIHANWRPQAIHSFNVGDRRLAAVLCTHHRNQHLRTHRHRQPQVVLHDHHPHQHLSTHCHRQPQVFLHDHRHRQLFHIAKFRLKRYLSHDF